VTHVRRQFGPVEGLHGTKEGLEVASTDGRWLLGVAVGGSAMAFLDGTVVNVALALGSADASRAGIASGINNAVARVAGLLAVAGLPVLVGITGDRFYEPATMRSGFHVAMTICAALAAAGGVLAWFTITGPLSTLPSPIRSRASAGRALRLPDRRTERLLSPVTPSREPGADGPGPPAAHGTVTDGVGRGWR
jgi:hypothetical protein